jgi:hypothetical protein
VDEIQRCVCVAWPYKWLTRQFQRLYSENFLSDFWSLDYQAAGQGPCNEPTEKQYNNPKIRKIKKEKRKRKKKEKTHHTPPEKIKT